MKRHTIILTLALCFATLASRASAQTNPTSSKDFSNSPLVTKMMAFDANKDGKLTKEELTDKRLHRLFDLADTHHDGVVTREQLIAMAAKLDAEFPAGRGGGGPGGPGGFDDGGFPGPGGRGGPGGPGGPGGFGPGGPGGRGFGRGPGGFGGPPQPGQILPGMLQDQLNLSPDQKKQVADLQKEVDAKLAKILTEEQLTQMKEMRGRGPGRNGGPPPPPDERQ